MTQIRRPAANQQRLKLVRVFIILAAISVLVLFLFQLDAFPNHKQQQQQRKEGLRAVTPDKLVSHEQQEQIQKEGLRHSQKEQQRGAVGDDKVSNSDGEEERAAPAGAAAEAAEADPHEQRPLSPSSDIRRYVMELANLKETSTTASTTGRVVFETHSSWSPLGVEHFHKLASSSFYDMCRFFRVIPNFMVQFGIAADPAVQRQWRGDVIKDDPVRETNARGTVTFATSGENSRTTQMFINTRPSGNAFLDKQGFSPIGKVLSGMEFVDRIVDRHREEPQQGKIQNRGNDYLQEQFPDLSYIVSIREVPVDERGDGLESAA